MNLLCQESRKELWSGSIGPQRRTENVSCSVLPASVLVLRTVSAYGSYQRLAVHFLPSLLCLAKGHGCRSAHYMHYIQWASHL